MSDNSEHDVIAGSGDSKRAQSNETSAGIDAGKLLLDWLQNHARFLQKTSQLILADARLAAASGLQLAVLALAFSLVFVCTWMVANVGIALLLMRLGISLGVIVCMILLLHIAMLIALSKAIGSTYEGLRFSASKNSLLGKQVQTERSSSVKDANNE